MLALSHQLNKPCESSTKKLTAISDTKRPCLRACLLTIGQGAEAYFCLTKVSTAYTKPVMPTRRPKYKATTGQSDTLGFKKNIAHSTTAKPQAASRPYIEANLWYVLVIGQIITQFKLSRDSFP